MCLSVLNQILRIDLVLLKHYKYGWVVEVIHTAVIEDGVSSIFGGGSDIARVSDSVVSHQNPTNKHVSSCEVSSVAVGVLRIPGEITAFAVGCAMCTTDSPVKVIEADGIYVFGICSMKQLPFFNISPCIILLHVIFLPLKNFPEGFVLNSLYLLNPKSVQSGIEHVLDLLVFCRSALQLHSLVTHLRY